MEMDFDAKKLRELYDANKNYADDQALEDYIYEHLPALLSSCERAERLEKAMGELLEALRRCVKTDPQMSGGSVLRGIDHVQFGSLVLPAISNAHDALSEHEASGKATNPTPETAREE
jgi:hypothetical protein